MGVAKTQTQMKNGTKLCPDYQQHRCRMQKERQCPKGQHKCAAMMTEGRVCAGPHGAGMCRNKNVIRK